ncbi:interleukin-1 receptor type 1 [Myxocyprinus asiaticus]|uniref:interleukin-1 receptor type 1 n=1 Tax=Myxocyprinus asiaticus TaxID=70543 RepID=UPI0022220D7A|nr:interleukin-1 receptor type 1 [Myxocyprinus asiaticus]
MGHLPLMFLVFLLWAAEGVVISNKESSGLETCRDFGNAFDRIYTVPGDATQLECSLDISLLFDSETTPYNITWYDQRTGSEITEVKDRIILRDNRLWFFNINSKHQGSYICVVRTPSECYKQATVLVVEEITSELCKISQASIQKVSAGLTELLACPLRSYSRRVDSFSFQWYKNCEKLQEDQKFVPKNDILIIRDILFEDAGFYTCKMNFTLAGVVGEMAENINCEVIDEYLKKPEMVEPINEVIKVDRGSPFMKHCRVFVAGNGIHMVEVIWKVSNGSAEEFISKNTADRIHQQLIIEILEDDGIWLIRSLWVSEVSEDDFNQTFICMAFSSRGTLTGQFTLFPADPNFLLPLGLVLGSLALLFIIGALLWRSFKVELILWVRKMFPFFYKTTDGDGKQYDAYVAYPRVLEGSSEMAEIFAMSTLPQVLEGQYGYKLFILGRDSLPGEAVVDVVQDALSRCRRLLLLYTASSLCSPEALEWAEQQTGLHRALLEKTIGIVLLEIEEIRDASQLPESVRLIREKQGALQAWKRRKRWMLWDRNSEDCRSSLNPSARFWREVHYHMPVRGKAKKSNVWFGF